MSSDLQKQQAECADILPLGLQKNVCAKLLDETVVDAVSTLDI